jgi:oxygen-dependent protoporphyrinogen oxidase
MRAALVAAPGLAVCGAALDGVGVPACIAAATRAADEVAADVAAEADRRTDGAARGADGDGVRMGA